MKTFAAVLINSLAAFLANTFVWFAVTFWVYLETRSVVATSVMAGIYTGAVAVSGFFLGSLVDRFPKKAVMLFSSGGSLLLFLAAGAIYAISPESAFADAANPLLWVFIVLTLLGAIAGNLRGIALSTLVTLMVPEERRDRANGLVGTANGVSFLAASVFSGLAVGFLGMLWVLGLAVALTILVIGHLWMLPIPRGAAAHGEAQGDMVDLPGTLAAIRQVPGLLGLIFFHTFNNFLGGIFMALMDAYGLLLVSVQAWGILWGFLSLGFIVGGLLVARRGLGRSPLRTLFLANIAMWSICSVFTLQASIALLAAGMFIWLCLIPMVEAAEQTILQQTIAPERQGRVFGFAQSVEQAATPVTALVIGPIAQFIFIPFMTTGAGVELIGGWFGVGADRGLALLFTLAGLVGLAVTLLAMRSRAYRALARTAQVPAKGQGLPGADPAASVLLGASSD
jgi:DHA3 family multidrug efflux protein-like MFS transporter